MHLTAGGKWLKSVLMVYLVLAIIGSFAFSAGQTFSYVKSDKDVLSSNIYFSSINHVVDWLAEDTPIVSKAQRNSNSPLRICLLRIFTITGIISIAMLFAKSNVKINKNNNFLTVNYLVPLKLRI